MSLEFSVKQMMSHSFVMTRDDDEYDLFRRRMIRAGFDDIPRKYIGKYPTVIARDIYTCAINHYVLVNIAKSMDWPSVAIFESDAYPMIDCRDKLDAFFAENGIPDDADEITLGNLHWIFCSVNMGSKDNCLRDVRSGYGKICGNLWGAHATVVFRKGYDTWLNRYLARKTQIAADFFNELTPNCYSTERSFFLQKKQDIQYYDWILDKENLKYFPSDG